MGFVSNKKNKDYDKTCHFTLASVNEMSSAENNRALAVKVPSRPRFLGWWRV